jgi:hypothetical protein
VSGNFSSFGDALLELDILQTCMTDEISRQAVRGLLVHNDDKVWARRGEDSMTYRRNGNPNPSFAPASEEIISRRARGTNLSEKGPFATACDRIGSVHVTHEPMTMEARRVILGIVM